MPSSSGRRKRRPKRAGARQKVTTSSVTIVLLATSSRRTRCANIGSVSRTWNRHAWTRCGKRLAKRDADVRWALGDWILAGEPHLPDVYAIAEKITGLTRSHIALPGAAACKRRAFQRD